MLPESLKRYILLILGGDEKGTQYLSDVCVPAATLL